jgi:hypothetical protein
MAGSRENARYDCLKPENVEFGPTRPSPRKTSSWICANFDVQRIMGMLEEEQTSERKESSKARCRENLNEYEKV